MHRREPDLVLSAGRFPRHGCRATATLRASGHSIVQVPSRFYTACLLRDRAYAPDVLFYFFPDNDLNLVFVVFGHLPFVIGGG